MVAIPLERFAGLRRWLVYVWLTLWMVLGGATAARAKDFSEQIRIVAEKWVAAQTNGDAGAMIDLMYSKMVEAEGGRDRRVSKTQAEFDALAATGIKIVSMRLEKAGEPVAAGGKLVSIVPVTTTVSTVTGQYVRFVEKAYLFAISTNQGASWKLLPGTLVTHPDTLHQILPEYPQDLKLPESAKIAEVELPKRLAWRSVWRNSRNEITNVSVQVIDGERWRFEAMTPGRRVGIVFVFDGATGASNVSEFPDAAKLFDSRTDLEDLLSAIAHAKPEATGDFGGRHYLRFSQTKEGKIVRILADAQQTFPIWVAGPAKDAAKAGDTIEYTILPDLPASGDAQLFDLKNVSNQFLKFLPGE